MLNVGLDTNCFNIYENPELDPIFQLEEEDKISIFFADAALFDVLKGKLKVEDLPERKRASAQKRLKKIKNFNLIKSWQTFSNHYNTFPLRFQDPKLKEKISDILFPDRKKKEGKYDESDVRHIYSHIVEKHDIFITTNTHDFINNGRRYQLKKFGINPLTPKEFLVIMKL